MLLSVNVIKILIIILIMVNCLKIEGVNIFMRNVSCIIVNMRLINVVSVVYEVVFINLFNVNNFFY